LDSAADRAATDDPRFPPISVAELNELDMDVWILWGPETVKARGANRVNAVTVGKHGLLISRGVNRGLLLPGVAVEHHFDTLTFLQQVCVKAGLPIDAWMEDDTELQVFEGEAIEGPLMPHRPEVRDAAVAGAFYPGDPKQVKLAVDDLFDGVNLEQARPWPGAMVPHAGWMYSGPLAAATLAKIAIPNDVIVFCPKHHAGGARWAVAPHQRWLFPGGELASNPELVARLVAGIDGLEADATPHRDEHAIEVQLPLLAHLAPHTHVVGITVGQSLLPELLQFGQSLAVVLRDMVERPLLLVSSDMNHFASDRETERLDRLALDAIATLDPEVVYETVRKNDISMCGMAGCVIVMEALRQLDCLKRCDFVGHMTSAKASGDTSRVVGYAGLLFG
jgi:AmmeMemoRadiSam system protein B